MKKLVISLLLVTAMLLSAFSPAMALDVADDSTTSAAMPDDQDLGIGDTTVDPNFASEVIPDEAPITGNEVTLQDGVIPDFPTPDKLYARISDLDGHQQLSVFFAPDEMLRAFYYRSTVDLNSFLSEYGMDTLIGLGVQLDLSVGNAESWQYTDDWNQFYQPGGELPKFLSLTSSAVEHYAVWDLADDNTFAAFQELDPNCVVEVEDELTGTMVRKFNTEQTTFYVRVRYFMEYLAQEQVMQDPEFQGSDSTMDFVSKFKISEWSNEASMGKDAVEESTLSMPEAVDSPTISNLSLMYTDMGDPSTAYLNFDISISNSTIEAEKYLRYTSDFGITKIAAEYRLGSGDWKECDITNSDSPLTGMERMITPASIPELASTNEEISIRTRYEYTYDGETLTTDWSNEISCIPAPFEVPDPDEQPVEPATETEPIEDVPTSEQPTASSQPQETEGGMDVMTIAAVAAIVVLLVVFVLLNQNKKCPDCGEKVKKKVETCPKCGHIFEKKNKKNKKNDGGNDQNAAVQQGYDNNAQQDYYQQNGYYDENGNYYDNSNGYYQQNGYDNNTYYDNNTGYADMVYCPNCGAANPQGSQQCSNCGCNLV